jgi:hypothetical protein
MKRCLTLKIENNLVFEKILNMQGRLPDLFILFFKCVSNNNADTYTKWVMVKIIIPPV